MVCSAVLQTELCLQGGHAGLVHCLLCWLAGPVTICFTEEAPSSNQLRVGPVLHLLRRQPAVDRIQHCQSLSAGRVCGGGSTRQRSLHPAAHHA